MSKKKLLVNELVLDSGIQPRASMDVLIIEEYAEDMKNGNQFPPIDVIFDGQTNWVWDGFHRVMAAKQIGMEEIEANVQNGDKRQAILNSVTANNTHGLRRTNEDKRRAVLRLLEDNEWGGWSDREIARRCGVHHTMVGRMRTDLSGAEHQIERKVQRGGTTYTQNTANIGATSPPDSPPEYTPRWLYDEHQEDTPPPPSAPLPKVIHNAGDNEWYTPKQFINAAKKVMGTIDLDPASSKEANDIVKANVFYDITNDGLRYEWHGNLWLNPPYARDLIDKFILKLVTHFNGGDVKQAITLTNNSTETRWFQSIALVSSAICLPEGRVKFWHPRKESTPLQGQAILYLGNYPDLFVEHFIQFGVVWVK